MQIFMTFRKVFFQAAVLVTLSACSQKTAMAGMPTVSLSDVGRLRFSTISFFLVLILVSAAGIRFLWNSVRRDFPALPLLSFRGALTGVILWGLVFVVVLTMISGARELMTPGAWIKNGLTYRQASEPQTTDSDTIAAEVKRQLNEQSARITQLQLLGVALREFADQHGGAWPTAEEFQQLPEELRTMPGDLQAAYLYRAADFADADSADKTDSVAVLEPAVLNDEQQLALFRSGVVGPFRRSP
jgi:hypothetical protein